MMIKQQRNKLDNYWFFKSIFNYFGRNSSLCSAQVGGQQSRNLTTKCQKSYQKNSKKDLVVSPSSFLSFYPENSYHNKNILSLMIGNLLGDGYAEKRKGSTRITFHLSVSNAEYIQWFSDFFSTQGHSSGNPIILKKQIGSKGKLYFSVKIRTYSSPSLNFLRSLFYVRLPFNYSVSNKKSRQLYRKVIPDRIENLLTPLVLATWCIVSGNSQNKNFYILIKNFSCYDILLLQKVLLEKYKLNTVFHKGKKTNTQIYPERYAVVEGRLYFSKEESFKLYKIVKPHVHKSMFYKFKEFINP